MSGPARRSWRWGMSRSTASSCNCTSTGCTGACTTPWSGRTAQFLADYYGGDKSQYDAIKGEWVYSPATVVATDGDLNAWNSMMSMVDSQSGDTLFNNIKQYVDVPDLIDYMILNIYGATSDWPENNWAAGASARPGRVSTSSSGTPRAPCAESATTRWTPTTGTHPPTSTPACAAARSSASSLPTGCMSCFLTTVP